MDSLQNCAPTRDGSTAGVLVADTHLLAAHSKLQPSSPPLRVHRLPVQTALRSGSGQIGRLFDVFPCFVLQNRKTNQTKDTTKDSGKEDGLHIHFFPEFVCSL